MISSPQCREKQNSRSSMRKRSIMSLKKEQKSISPRLRDWAQEQALLDVTVRENKYIPHKPTPKQEEFLALNSKEAFYGGAAGGGKSDALLMAALQYITVPGYSALILRKTYTDLSLPEALMDRAQEWLHNTDARWSEKDKQWMFPNEATLNLGYMESENNKYRYQSSAFQFVGYDEVTQFPESQYLYLFSRLRGLKGMNVPLRMRSASNPGNVGHDWIKQRFINPGREDRPYIRALLQDNPFLNREEYRDSLSQLDPITREQLLNGDWDVVQEGAMFKQFWFEVVNDFPADCEKVRYWDMAATEPKKGKDPDWTVGVLLGLKDGITYIIDAKRDRLSPQATELMIQHTAQMDGQRVQVGMEEEGGSSGKIATDHYRRDVLLGFNFKSDRPTGAKTTRASLWASPAEAGNVKVVRGEWNEAFFSELQLFPLGAHDDQVDAVSGAYNMLTHRYIYPHVSVADPVARLGKLGREIEELEEQAKKEEVLA